MKFWTHLLTEPRDFAYCYAGRLACRLLGRHGVTCDGRSDHQRWRHQQHKARANAA